MRIAVVRAAFCIVMAAALAGCAGGPGGVAPRRAAGEPPAPPVEAAGVSPAALGADGRAEAWLVAGTWGGPAGLSLLGLDTENELRPCEGDPVPLRSFDSLSWTNWTAAARDPAFGYVIVPVGRNTAWAKGTSYAALYVACEQPCEVSLAITHGGIDTALFVNGGKLAPASRRRLSKGTVKSTGTTDQGNTLETVSAAGGTEAQFAIPLSHGVNRILVKMIRQDAGGAPVAFDAVFSQAKSRAGSPCPQDGGAPLSGLSTATSDPETDPEKHAALARMTAAVNVDAVANLPRPGDEVRATTAITFPWQKPKKGGKNASDRPVGEALQASLPFPAVLEQWVTDWDGREVARASCPIDVPGTNSVSFGHFPDTGYYCIHTQVKDAAGHILRAFPSDGFSVLPGAADGVRPLPRKIATCFYWIGGKSWDNAGIFDWMERMDIRHNVGGNIANTNLFEMATARGITLTADFLDPWSSAKEWAKRDAAAMAAGHTRLFKAWNEIDICPKQRGDGTKWSERTKLEHRLVHEARPDAIYTGGTLVRPAKGDWFDACLTNGIYDAVDVWDVHAYPLKAPKFSDRHISNSPDESGPAVEACIRRTLGRENDKPFILGECGARSCHGYDARRWQASMVAKMAAWGVANTNYLQIAFLVPWNKTDNGGDIPVAHYPAEAALFTVANLIDGFPAEEVPGLPRFVEARRFGRTVMFWSTGNKPVEIALPAPAKEGPWAVVDVVGRVRPAASAPDGTITLSATSAPQYLLPASRLR